MIPRQKLPACRRCPFYTHHFVPPEGNENADIVFVGDSPWRQERKENRPFRGPAGQILDFVLEESDIERKDVFITNTVSCLPEALGVPYPEGVIEHCVEHFLKPTLKHIQPRIVVPMGNVALKVFTTDRGGITKARGLKCTVNFYGMDIDILPTYHPSYVLCNPAFVDQVVADVIAAKDADKPLKRFKETKYRAVDTDERFARFFGLISEEKIISWDIETTGLDFYKDDVISMQFSFAPYTGYAILFYTKYPEKNPQIFNIGVIKKLWKLLHSGKVIFGHNFKFDLRMMHQFFLQHLGYGIRIDDVRWYDTQAQYGLLDENGLQRLKVVAPLHTDIRYTREQLENVSKRVLQKIPKQKLVDYGCLDVDATRRIGLKFAKKLVEDGLWYGPFVGKDYSDMSVANVLFKMELFGAPVDLKEMRRLKYMIDGRLDDFTQTMIRHAEQFNPRAPAQLARILFDVLQFPDPGIRTEGGNRSTDKHVIAALLEDYGDHPFLQALKLYRQYDAIQKMYINGFGKRIREDGRLHPDFGFANTVSGRIVCYAPNLENIPHDREFEEGVFVSIRNMFAARPGWCILYADTQQAEFKTSALASGDEKLIEDIFVHRADFHSLIARAAYPDYANYEKRVKKLSAYLMENRVEPERLHDIRYAEDELRSLDIQLKNWRTNAKKRNFGKMYGGQDEILASSMGISVEEVQELDANIAEQYPVFSRWIERTQEEVLEAGETRSPFGRIRRFPATPDERTRKEQGRQGLNFKGQSPAAYCERGALVRIVRELESRGMQAFPFDIVYDSVMLECPLTEVEEACIIVAEEMLRPVQELDNHIFTIEMGIGDSWAKAEKAAVKVNTVEDVEHVLEKVV